MMSAMFQPLTSQTLNNFHKDQFWLLFFLMMEIYSDPGEYGADEKMPLCRNDGLENDPGVLIPLKNVRIKRRLGTL